MSKLLLRQHIIDSESLALAPEMATVRVVTHSLLALRIAVVAEHTTLRYPDELHRRGGPPVLRAARTLIRQSFEFEDIVNHYSTAVHRASRRPYLRDDDIF